MWTSQIEDLSKGRVRKVTIGRDAAPMTYAEVLRCWREDAEFRSYFNGLLSEAPFSAFRWECPPVDTTSIQQPFEFVLLNSPGLARKPDRKTFVAHFQGAGQGVNVVSFFNLGRDALMVVPCPEGPDSAYGHLAAFVREAPEAQRQALWKLVGEVMEQRLSNKPVWLSTAGAGVSWLHLRLDDRPKYYGHKPYRNRT